MQNNNICAYIMKYIYILIIIYKKQLDDYDPKHMYNDKNYVHKNYT
jgi:hypothetical protein